VNTYVVDASVAIKWFMLEIHSEAALRLRKPTYRLQVPALFLLECGNFICKKLRRGEISVAESDFMINKLRTAKLEWHPDEPLFPSAFAIANKTGRSLYDGLYLSLAIAIDGQMVTADLKFYESLKTGPYANRLLWVEDIPQSTNN